MAPSHCFPTAFRLPLVARLGRSTPTFPNSRYAALTLSSDGDSTRNRLGPHITSIHVLDDDSLLNIFHLYRPVLLDKDEVRNDRNLQGGIWDRERWWYKLAQVCQRWRYLILGSASYLQLCLPCTYGTPVAEMLAHSPSLPLVLDYIDENRVITAEEEKRIMLALGQRDRVRRIRLLMRIQVLRKVITDIDDKFPVLEFLYLEAPTKDNRDLILPGSFRAPHLRHLVLINFNVELNSPLLTTPVALITLSLQKIQPSSAFRPNDLLQRLALMPQLETLGIHFHPPLPNSNVERLLLDMPITHATLPNLRWFGFGGATAYLEVFLSRMTTPLLEKFQLRFSNESTFSVPRLLQFMSTAKNLRLTSARFEFNGWGLSVFVYPHEGAKMYALELKVICRHLNSQVPSVAQLFDVLSPAFSAVEHLTLSAMSPVLLEGQNEVDETQWRKLLKSFGNVKSLLVGGELVEEVSRCLRSEDGELPLELLPELRELSYAGKGGAFAGFVNARQVAGHPVHLVRLQSPFVLL